MSRFSNLVSGLRGADERDRILQVLNASCISGEEALRDIVQGSTKPEVTLLLHEELHLTKLDASALAGVLCQPGKLIDFYSHPFHLTFSVKFPLTAVHLTSAVVCPFNSIRVFIFAYAVCFYLVS
jgi:hypothetical protein